ncbi:hypothetical protein CLOM_g1627 [Closterium sp. NIES-68]|nr:hypothetical protein CLOM_g1627 [Closterium sp. NIES-68]
MGDEEERRAGKGKGVSEGSGRGSKKGEGCEEEEEAVAVIAGVLMEKFGPQIVREELEEGGGNGRNESHEDVKRAKAKGEEEGVDKEAEEADAEASAEDSPAATSRPTRVVSPASLLSLYRFFSSHLGISSPSTVASILASCPAILRSDPITDLLTHVHLLQSYGISHADIVHITLKNPGWLRTSLAQIQDTLEFLLARGVRRSRLGFLLRRGRGLICRQAHSMNLDILVERAGVPVDKLGVVLEKFPNILSWSKESLMFQLEQLSVYFTKGCGGR